MEESVLSQYLTFETCTLTDELIQRARTELNENIETRTLALNILREKIKGEKNLVSETDDFFLLAFLRTGKFNVEKAFIRYTRHYRVLGKYSKIYKNIDFSIVRQTLEDRPMGILPYRNKDGSAIMVFKIKGWDPYKQSLATLIQAMACGSLHAMLNPVTQVAGFTVILDIGDLTLRQLPHLSPSVLWLVVEQLQNLAMRTRSILWINANLIFKSLWMIMKPMFSKKMRERVRFFGNNYADLHELVPPEILPAEYGGNLPPFDNTNWRRQVFEYEDYIKQSFQNGYRE